MKWYSHKEKLLHVNDCHKIGLLQKDDCHKVLMSQKVIVEGRLPCNDDPD